MEYDKALAQQSQEALSSILARESCVIQKRSKKAKSGFVELDIIPQIQQLESLEASENTLQMQILLKAQNPGLNPDLLIGVLRKEYPELSPDYSHFHRVEILDEEGAVFL